MDVLKKELTYEYIERVFINVLDGVKKLTVSELTDKLRLTHGVCKKNNDLSNVCFAYYDLYFTELLNKKFNFRPETIAEFNKNKIIIRKHNSYAKLVAIFNDNDTNHKSIMDTSVEYPFYQLLEPPNNLVNMSVEPPNKPTHLSVEPPNKKINLDISYQNEKEWADWIFKNQEYVIHFNPLNFVKMIEKF